ncbi:hypothetical protein [Paenibacillus harenae]|uniref:hypothetical protein n=1 Tax=Paenibacillus harenae TaxID=306543 RepID=UPI0004902B22|nr:hypothetical protein [Paenibacillus harenae]
MFGIEISSATLLAAACFLVYQPKEIMADRVYGIGTFQNEYSISTSPAGENMIPSTLQQYNEVSDDSRTNISYTVIYEQNKWFKNNQE